MPPLTLEDTLESANLTDYLALLRQSGMLEQVKNMQGVTLLAPVQGTLNQLRNFTTAQPAAGVAPSSGGQQVQQQPVQAQPQQQQPPQQQTQPQSPQGVIQPQHAQQMQQQPPQQQPVVQQPVTQQQQPGQTQPMQQPVSGNNSQQLNLPQQTLSDIVRSSIIPGVYYSPCQCPQTARLNSESHGQSKAAELIESCCLCVLLVQPSI